jgi:opacity protein-like surface antigen
VDISALSTRLFFDSTTTSRIASLAVALLAVGALVLAGASNAEAQDWGSDPEDDWSTPAQSSPAASPSSALTGWSLRAGIGFTEGPETFLMNFEVPYAFDRWVSAGPMLQVGVDNNETIVAPTMNVTLSIPDMPGTLFDRVVPYTFAGMGFAVIEDDNRRGDNSSVGFLIPFGFGVEYRVSDRIALGSQMTLNFLPKETLDQNFWFSWQIGGVRFSF